MSKYYYFKWPLVILIIGFIIWVLGSMMKVLHWVGADTMFLGATVILIIGFLFLLIKVITVKK